jgi:radical SAM superfamily enzyme YgiQ (UPF0313 family)
LSLTDPQLLKFDVLAEGISISLAARSRLDAYRGDRPLSPADFASTSGLILRLEDDVWVNAPVRDFNPNFVDQTPTRLDVADDGFVITGARRSSQAAVWLPPAYHGTTEVGGRPATDYVISHGDRVRLSPMRGCSMKCKFCNVPYDDPYETKSIDDMVPALRLAFDDPLQPAHHVLISGGTPSPKEVPYLREAYETVLTAFPHVDIDIMMVPIDDLLDVKRLKDLGLHNLSINIELVNEDIARYHMPQKLRKGLSHYLHFIADATELLGPGRVRSMMMVGLEPAEDTLRGVEAILRAGGVPVLSPFRPDPATPLRDRRPLGASELALVYERAAALAAEHGATLGPECPPCTHNTLSFATTFGGRAVYPYPEPLMV